jgi:hypothetical protein
MNPWDEISIESREPPCPTRRTGWQSVRLYISSTFSDFYSEREHLVKAIAPGLRQFCEEKKIRLVEVDLRWGLPQNSTGADAIYCCFQELLRCKQENDQPFFLSMLSAKYGWIPPPEIVSADIMSRFGFVPGFSLTANEIIAAAYRSANPNALFAIRSPDFLQKLPKDQRSFFDDSSHCEKNAHLLEELKEKVKQQFSKQLGPGEDRQLGLKQYFEYSVRVRQRSAYDTKGSVDKMHFEGLEEAFAPQVEQFFRRAISRQYPYDDSGAGMQVSAAAPANQTLHMQLVADTDAHRMFLEMRSATLLGRSKESRVMLKYALGAGETDANSAASVISGSGSGSGGGSGTSQGEQHQPQQAMDVTASASALMSTANVAGHVGHVSSENRSPTLASAEDALAVAESQLNVPLVLCGEAGAGKSALMAACAEALVQHSIADSTPYEMRVFYHFVGAAPGSTDLVRLLRRLWAELDPDNATHEPPPSTLPQLIQGLKGVVAHAGALWDQGTEAEESAMDDREGTGAGSGGVAQQERPKRSRTRVRSVILIDAVNQLFDDATDRAHALEWLPTTLPPGVTCIVSMIHATATHQAAMRRRPPPQCVTVGPLDMFSKAEIVRRTLAEYNKTLHPRQAQSLLTKKASSNPLWLTTACEELRVCGSLEGVDEHIAALPESLLGLLSRVLARLESDSAQSGRGGMLVVAAVCLLECSRHGLLEAELLELLGMCGGNITDGGDGVLETAALLLPRAHVRALSRKHGWDLDRAEEARLRMVGQGMPAEEAASGEGSGSSNSRTCSSSSNQQNKMKEELRASAKRAYRGGEEMREKAEGEGGEEQLKKKKKKKTKRGRQKQGARVCPRLIAARWSPVYHALRVFLRPCGSSGEGRLDFYHRAVSKAVRMRYFGSFQHAMDGGTIEAHGQQEASKDAKDTQECYSWYHGKLADYFERHCIHEGRRAEELPHHLEKVLDNSRLMRCLLEWPTFHRLFMSGGTELNPNPVDLLHYWRSLGGYGVASSAYMKAVALLDNEGQQPALEDEDEEDENGVVTGARAERRRKLQERAELRCRLGHLLLIMGQFDAAEDLLVAALGEAEDERDARARLYNLSVPGASMASWQLPEGGALDGKFDMKARARAKALCRATSALAMVHALIARLYDEKVNAAPGGLSTVDLNELQLEHSQEVVDILHDLRVRQRALGLYLVTNGRSTDDAAAVSTAGVGQDGDRVWDITDLMMPGGLSVMQEELLMRNLASIGLARPFNATCTCVGAALCAEFVLSAQALDECMQLGERTGNCVMQARAVKYQGALSAEMARASARGMADFDVNASFAEAIAHGDRALRLFTEAVGEVHLETAWPMFNTAMVILDMLK